MGREQCARHSILTPSPTNNGVHAPVGAGLPVFLIGGVRRGLTPRLWPSRACGTSAESVPRRRGPRGRHFRKVKNTPQAPSRNTIFLVLGGWVGATST